MAIFCPVETKTLKEIVESADVKDDIKKIVINFFEENKIFDEEKIGSIELGILIGNMIQRQDKSFVKKFSPMFNDIHNRNKLPIVD